MMRWWFFLLISVAWCAHGATPTDFAYGLQLETPPGSSVYVVELPTPVYVGVTRSDLGDLRVFNARNQEVPFSLRQPKLVEGDAPEPQAVPLFPLYGEAAQAPNLALRVQTDPRGAIVDLQSGRTLDEEEAIAYLVDLSALQARPMALELQWQTPKKSRGFVAHVSLSASDDLVHWNNVVSDATLAEVGYRGNRLERRQVELPAFTGKYLRIEWPQAARSVVLTAAHARFAAPASYRSRQWIPLEGKPEIKDPNRFQFYSGGRFPVECARVVPRESNSAIRFSLSSRAADDQAWQHRGEGLVYKLSFDNEELVSEPFCFDVTADKQWRLEVAANGGGFGQARPVLELGWTPHRLVFVARGRPPFTLAYGSTHATPGGLALDPLLKDLEAKHLGMSKATVTGTPFALGGPAQQVAAREIPWRRILLWSLLVIGVAALAWMAVRLTREMGNPKSH